MVKKAIWIARDNVCTGMFGEKSLLGVRRGELVSFPYSPSLFRPALGSRTGGCHRMISNFSRLPSFRDRGSLNVINIRGIRKVFWSEWKHVMWKLEKVCSKKKKKLTDTKKKVAWEGFFNKHFCMETYHISVFENDFLILSFSSFFHFFRSFSLSLTFSFSFYFENSSFIALLIWLSSFHIT